MLFIFKYLFLSFMRSAFHYPSHLIKNMLIFGRVINVFFGFPGVSNQRYVGKIFNWFGIYIF
jgi:hypothetical protein